VTGVQTCALPILTKTAASKLLPGTRSNVLSTIQGKAFNALHLPMANTNVRLRDARSGGIANTTITDTQGVFVFHEVDPGTYVVELMANKIVVGSSQLLNVGAGDALSAMVTMPFQTSAVAGALGGTQSAAAAITNAAQVVTAAAAASNIGAQTLTGAAATSTSTTNGR